MVAACTWMHLDAFTYSFGSITLGCWELYELLTDVKCEAHAAIVPLMAQWLQPHAVRSLLAASWMAYWIYHVVPDVIHCWPAIMAVGHGIHDQVGPSQPGNPVEAR